MSGWLGEDSGFRIVLVEAVGILPDAVYTCPVVVGVACAGPLSGSRLFGN